MDITVPQNCVVKVEKIAEEELYDTFENGEHEMLRRNSDGVNSAAAVLLHPKVEVEEEEVEEQEVKTEYSTRESPLSGQNDSEETKPMAILYLFPLEEEQLEDFLVVDPLAGCEEWNEKKPLTDLLLFRVEKEEAAEAEEDERSEQTAAEEMKVGAEDASDRKGVESPSEQNEASEPEKDDIRTHSNRRPFACPHCSGAIRYNKTLEEHKRECPEEPQLLTCDTCQLQFTARITLVRHTRARTNESDKKTKFLCEICGKEVKRRCDLERHMCVHTGEKPYVCEHCGKGFGHSSNLNTHLRQHTGEKPYSCSICKKWFSSKSNLLKHKRRHLNIRRYECKECGKTFMLSSDFTTHLRVHTGERPFKCSICSKTFAKKGTLNSHKRIHTGERPYKCRSCEVTFTERSNRLKHEETHSERQALQCKECGKSILSKESLKRHMRCHTAQEPFKRGYCDKSFAQSRTRNRHEETHTTAAPSVGRGCHKKSDLDKHLPTHGKQKPRAKREWRAKQCGL